MQRARLLNLTLLPLLFMLPAGGLNAHIVSIQRILYGSLLIDSVPRNQFPRGASYTAIVQGAGLRQATGFTASDPNVTGYVTSATDTDVAIQISTPAVGEGNTASAPIPSVSFTLQTPSGVISSGSVTFDIVVGPPPQVTLRITNGVKWIPAGVPTKVIYEASVVEASGGGAGYAGFGAQKSPCLNAVHCSGGGASVDSYISTANNFGFHQFEYTVTMVLIITAPRDFSRTYWGCFIGAIDGAGQGGVISKTFPDSPGISNLPLVQIQFVDPVADNPATTLLNGPAVTTDTTLLADQGRGRIVKGIAADGVAQLLVRIAGAPPNERFLLLVTEGSVANIALSPSFQSTVSLTADSSGIAFVVYKSPTDFARSSTDNVISRVVTLNYSSPDNNPSVIVGDSPITVVRPPVVLIHGNWSNSTQDWQFFQFAVSPPPVQIYRADYSAFLDKGVSAAASAVLPQVHQMVEAFKQGALTVDGFTMPVAAVQADLVAYSLGGLVSRALVKRPFYSNTFNYAKGYVHKLITLDTPHLGSELATALLGSSGACQTLFATFVGPVSQNIKDMVPNSPLLTSLATANPSGVHLPTAVIASDANATQESAADTAYFNSVLYQLPGNIPGPCRRLLPAGGYRTLFAASGFPGGSDLIVSAHSQIATGLGLGGPVPATIFSGSFGAVHAVNPPLFPSGPDVRQSNLVGGTRVGVTAPFPSTEHVLQLLNSPISSFQPIVP